MRSVVTASSLGFGLFHSYGKLARSSYISLSFCMEEAGYGESSTRLAGSSTSSIRQIYGGALDKISNL
jgi:hypothetical protein